MTNPWTFLRSLFNRPGPGNPGQDEPAPPETGGALSNEALQSRMAHHPLLDLLKERRGERRWKWVRRLAFSGMALAGSALYLATALGGLGYRADFLPGPPDRAGVVRIEGPIMAGALASADKVVPALERAFARDGVKAVVLAIDSPGGQPGEGEAIMDALDRLKAKTHKPVWAVIGNTGASAAYMIALRADHIVAGRYSLVGSIGAKLEGWGLHRMLGKLEVDHHMFASGGLKDMLDPYAPLTPEAAAKAQALVDRLGAAFKHDLERGRAGKLKPGVDYATGEAWTGEEALRLGLIDEVGTLHTLVKERLALEPSEFGPANPAGGLLPFATELGRMLLASLAQGGATVR